MNEPSSIRAGDTSSWISTLPNYTSADGWALKYHLGGPAQINFAADSTFTVTINAVDSQNWVPGIYEFVAWVERGSGNSFERHTINDGRIEILPNLAIAKDAIEGRSHVKITLDNIQAAIRNYSVNPYAEIMIAGRQKRNWSLADLIKWESIYKGYYMNELQAQKINAGGKGRQIHVRMGPTS